MYPFRLLSLIAALRATAAVCWAQAEDFHRFHAGCGGRLIAWVAEDLPIAFHVARSNEAWRAYIHFKPRF
jgi:hypothetical protein